MIINISEIDGWEKDDRKTTRPGKFAHYIAVNTSCEDVSVFLTDPGGKGEDWKVNVGRNHLIGNMTNACGSNTSFDSKDEALLSAAKFMKKNPKIIWDSGDDPPLRRPDGGHIKKTL